MFGNKTKRAINASEAMAASLGMFSDYVQDDTEKIASVADKVENVRYADKYAGYAGNCAGFEKIAGIYIDKPTQENIEDFVRRYVHNELTFFPRTLEVTVEFIPSEFDKVQKDHVLEGTGVVGIKIFHKVLELPFLITGGELMPFDIIQMDGQRVPYSRDNVQKIILNLDKQIQMEQQGASTNSPYLGTEGYINPSTVPGFMGDVLSIRDTHSLRKGNGQYVTAGEYDYGFEKEALFSFGKPKKIESPAKNIDAKQVANTLKADPAAKQQFKKEFDDFEVEDFGAFHFNDKDHKEVFDLYEGLNKGTIKMDDPQARKVMNDFIGMGEVSLKYDGDNPRPIGISVDNSAVYSKYAEIACELGFEKIAYETSVLSNEAPDLQDNIVKDGQLIHVTDTGNQFILHNNKVYFNHPKSTGKTSNKPIDKTNPKFAKQAMEFEKELNKQAEDPLAQMNKVNDMNRQSFMGGVAEEKESAEEDLLGLGVFSNKRRTAEDAERAKEKTEKEKSTTPAPEGEEEKTAGIKDKALNFATNLSGKNIKNAARMTLDDLDDDMVGGVLDRVSKAKAATKKARMTAGAAVGGTALAGIGGKALYDSRQKQAEIVTDLNALLEKSASIKPMSEEEYEAITFVLQKHAAQKEKDYLEKLAADEENETPTRKELRDMEAKANVRFYDAKDMPHGTFIVFPEMNGTEISLTPGVVLSDFSELKIKKHFSNFKCVVSQDGRMKILDGEKFICKPAPDRAFKFPTTSLASLTDDDVFFALMGDKVLVPSVVKHVSELKLGGFGEGNSVRTVGKCLTLQAVTDTSAGNIFRKDVANEGYSVAGRYSVLTLNDKRFEYMNYNTFLQDKAKEQVLSTDIINAIVPKYDLNLGLSEHASVLVTDDNSKIIKVKGSIDNNFKTQDEYEMKTKLSESGYDVEKVAFSINTVTIVCTDRRSKVFNVTVEYRDTEERFMNLRRQQFNSISEGKLRAILRITKFQGSQINEIIYKAKNEPRASYPIPESCTVEDIKKLQGGAVTNVSKESVKAAVSKYINPFEITKTLAVATAADMIGRGATSMITPDNVKKMGKVFNFINKIASEAGELSATFEKLAAEHESEEFLDYARALATSSFFHEKLATAMKDERNCYPSVVDVAHEIVMAKPVFEKFAYDLTALKINQQIHKQEIVNPNVVSHAILGLDQLYKTARAIEAGFDKDNLKFM